MELGEDKPALIEPERKPSGVLRCSLLPLDHRDWLRGIELRPFHLIAPKPLLPCILPRKILDRAIDVVQLARDLRFLTKNIDGSFVSFFVDGCFGLFIVSSVRALLADRSLLKGTVLTDRCLCLVAAYPFLGLAALVKLGHVILAEWIVYPVVSKLTSSSKRVGNAVGVKLIIVEVA